MGAGVWPAICGGGSTRVCSGTRIGGWVADGTAAAAGTAAGGGATGWAAGAGALALVVADNGVGLPEAPDSPSAEGRLGLHLVPRLAKQAHAALRLDSNGGTRATLSFALA